MKGWSYIYIYIHRYFPNRTSNFYWCSIPSLEYPYPYISHLSISYLTLCFSLYPILRSLDFSNRTRRHLAEETEMAQAWQRFRWRWENQGNFSVFWWNEHVLPVKLIFSKCWFILLQYYYLSEYITMIVIKSASFLWYFPWLAWSFVFFGTKMAGSILSPNGTWGWCFINPQWGDFPQIKAETRNRSESSETRHFRQLPTRQHDM
jgi:hypothetical protein